RHSIVFGGLCTYCYGDTLAIREEQRRARLGIRYHAPVMPFSYERPVPHQTKSLFQRLMDLLR
ncbi:MAG TPA: hypothetical protein VFB56_00255, partial [Nitrospiraceae bacterium]|nr:hypothetical protein [Nitrospiraceae bacterium]